MLKTLLDKSSYHAVYDESILEALHFAHANGFSGVQVAVESPHLSFERLSEQDCSGIRDYCRRNGLYVTLHAPDQMVSLFETSRYLREGIFHYFEAMLAFAEQIDVRLITIHPGKISSFGTDTTPRTFIPNEDRPKYQQAFAENLQRLVDLNGRRRIVCIENFGMDAMVCDLLQPYLTSGALSLCWDLAKSNVDLDDFFRANFGHIRQVHLHDQADGTSHRAVGTGRLPFMRYLPRLSRANVLDFCHEVRPRERAVESLANLKRMIETATPISAAEQSLKQEGRDHDPRA